MKYGKDYGIPDYGAYGILQKTPSNTDLFITTNFTLSIKRCPTLTYFTQSVAVSELGGEPLDIQYAISPIVKSPKAAAAFKNFTVNFLIDPEFKNYKEVLDWIYEGTPYIDLTKVKPIYECLSEAFIIVTSNRKLPTLKFTLRNIFPVELSGFEVKNTDTEAAPLVASAQFAIGQTIVEEL